MILALLLLHGLAAVALLGILTHQAVAIMAGRQRSAGMRGASASGGNAGFPRRYTRVSAPAFTGAVIVLFPVVTLLGGLIYPAYRLDVRVPLEEMQLGWAIGLFELKEHFIAVGLFLLPVYSAAWSGQEAVVGQPMRVASTLLLAGITWFSFLVGHVLNNLRGL